MAPSKQNGVLTLGTGPDAFDLPTLTGWYLPPRKMTKSQDVDGVSYIPGHDAGWFSVTTAFDTSCAGVEAVLKNDTVIAAELKVEGVSNVVFERALVTREINGRIMAYRVLRAG